MSCHLNESLLLAPNIFLNLSGCDANFVQQTHKAIQLISSKPVGVRLLQKIAKPSQTITISFDSLTAGTCSLYSSKLSGNTRIVIKISHLLQSKALNFKIQEIEMPYFIKIAHELIHGHRTLKGKNITSTECNPEWTDNEEYRTINGGSSKKAKPLHPKISENAIREEHQLPLRYSHLGRSQLGISTGNNVIGITEEEKKTLQVNATAQRTHNLAMQLFFGDKFKFGAEPAKVHQVSKESWESFLNEYKKK